MLTSPRRLGLYSRVFIPHTFRNPRRSLMGQSLSSRHHVNTREAYQTIPTDLQRLSWHRQGLLFENLSRLEHARQGWVVEDAVGGLSVAGYGRGVHSAEYDYTIRVHREGTPHKVEVKSSRLCWDRASKRWQVIFYGVKLEELNVLVLGVLLPSGAQLWKYDISCCNYMSTLGKSTDIT
eukprot:4407097-Amphidinium_carterae.1